VGEVYLPILILGILGAAFAIFSVSAPALIGPRRYNRARLDSYECGIDPTPQAMGGGKFPIKYYLTAMLFIIFDIEIVFLYPWAVNYQALGLFGLVAVLIFSALVFESFVYLISKGALDWGPLQVSRRQDPMRSADRTTASTVRRVGQDGRTITVLDAKVAADEAGSGVAA